MLTSEFTNELAALVRRLEGRVREQPELRHNPDPALRLEQAIVALVALYFDVRDASE